MVERGIAEEMGTGRTEAWYKASMRSSTSLWDKGLSMGT